MNWINIKDQAPPMNEIILVTNKKKEICLVEIEQWGHRLHFRSVGIFGHDWEMDIDRVEDVDFWCKVELPTKELK